MNKKTLVVGLLWAMTPVLGVSAASAAGTTNGNASCVARLNTTEGTPGQNVENIKKYLSPIPGALVSTVAHSDRTDCALPG